VGCAQGEFAAVASQRGLHVFGVDLNAEAVRKANQRVPEGTFWCGEIGAATEAGPFDLITMFDFIEHVRDPLETLRQPPSCSPRADRCSCRRRGLVP
jgi:2-polyprenyl-3-methyl-5-hydroxy-6-metoxy-1,4-benzoquinol methylase